MQRYGRLFFFLLFCSAAQFVAGQRQPFKAEIVLTRSFVKSDEIFRVNAIVRNVGTTEQSLVRWDCSYPDQWRAANPAVHVKVVSCQQNVPGKIQLQPGGTYKWPISLFIHFPRSQTYPQKVTFRLGYGNWAYFGTQDAAPKIPLFWSNTVTVVVIGRGALK